MILNIPLFFVLWNILISAVSSFNLFLYDGFLAKVENFAAALLYCWFHDLSCGSKFC